MGSLYTSGNVERNVDYPVNPIWIFTMVESGKLTYQVSPFGVASLREGS